MPSRVSFSFCVVHVVAKLAIASGQGFLPPQRRGAASEEDFRAAMGTVMGCGGEVATAHLAAVEQSLLPMWRVLPKNQQGLVEWRMVRYLAHRYFMQQSSLLVRGFEPMRQINSSHMGAADILSKKVPSIVDSMLESKRTSNGFSLDEAVTMVATLEQLMSDAESTLLETVYKQQKKSPKQTLSHVDLSNVIEAYMIHWMMDDDQQVIQLLLRNRTLLMTALPKWHEIKSFVDGLVKTMEFSRQRAPRAGHGHAAMAGQYSFEDAHEAVTGITKKFASYWESECQVIKEALVAMDKKGIGRVSLADFYGANADGQWRFGESEAYLRELGALDESSSWRGKQVIIPNYMQGASNCIVATPHYLVCCVNECESVLNDIEAALGAPVADPVHILDLVGNMTNFDDKAPKIDASLREQLWRIAETHGGKVPLHGRLFAQWLHYVFPQECPFPHKSGQYSAITPLQFGESYIVSDSDLTRHAAARANESMLEDHKEVQWMSQWSEEEELIADYSMQLRAPWEGSRYVAIGGVAFAFLLLFGARVTSTESKAKPSRTLAMTFESKSHYV